MKMRIITGNTCWKIFPNCYTFEKYCNLFTNEIKDYTIFISG
jgi:hypothetical protein